MKKILSIIGSLGIITTGICSTIALTSLNNKLPDYKWENIDLYHRVSTKGILIHEKRVSEVIKSEKLTDLDYNFVNSLETITLNGKYRFTFDEKSYVSELDKLKLKRVESNNHDEIIFEIKIHRYLVHRIRQYWFDLNFTLTVNQLENSTGSEVNLKSFIQVESKHSVTKPMISASHDSITF